MISYGEFGRQRISPDHIQRSPHRIGIDLTAQGSRMHPIAGKLGRLKLTGIHPVSHFLSQVNADNAIMPHHFFVGRDHRRCFFPTDILPFRRIIKVQYDNLHRRIIVPRLADNTLHAANTIRFTPSIAGIVHRKFDKKQIDPSFAQNIAAQTKRTQRRVGGGNPGIDKIEFRFRKPLLQGLADQRPVSFRLRNRTAHKRHPPHLISFKANPRIR
ncbi:MAG: hypothetical protein BWY71_01947 [Planctomycetes bacterium ADurb.Bin412]|nr:MAG: hypothetical protein BWY71_01947 [Planctomycetes bacterium ADurb.Bin412]